MRRRTMLMGGATLVLQPVAGHAETLDDGSFAQHVVALLAASHPDWTVTADGDPLSIKIGSVSVFLRNIHLHTREMPAKQRDAEIVTLIERGFSPPFDTTATFDAVGSSLRIQIEPIDYLAKVPTIFHQDFMAGLMRVCTVDQAYRYATLLQPQLDTWQRPREAVEQVAVANLEGQSDQVPVQRERHTGTGAYVTINVGDGYDAARLLLPRFMKRVRDALGSPTVFAAIPNRDFLVAWTNDFSKRVAFASLVARDIHRQPHPLTDALFVVSESDLRQATAAELANHGR
ncbi:MAG: hypothetical protein ACRYF2_19100 [Janthinobacterium lividum]